MTTTEFNLPTWCQLRAERFRDFEQHEMAMYPDSDSRDMAIVEWTIRCLANPKLPDAREALALIADQHDDELNPRGTNEWWKNRVAELRTELAKAAEQNTALTALLAQSRTNAATEVGRLVAENARLRQDRDTKADIAKSRAVIITNLGAALNAHAAVVEAAKAWVASSVAEFGRTGDALTDAVNALPKAEATGLVCGCGIAPDGAPGAEGCSPQCMQPVPDEPIDPQGTGWTQGDNFHAEAEATR